MLASCDLSSFVLVFMTKVCKGESRKIKTANGGGGGGERELWQEGVSSTVFYSHHFLLRAQSRSNGNKTLLF